MKQAVLKTGVSERRDFTVEQQCIANKLLESQRNLNIWHRSFNVRKRQVKLNAMGEVFNI